MRATVLEQVRRITFDANNVYDINSGESHLPCKKRNGWNIIT
jgi:hypothetical protein